MCLNISGMDGMKMFNKKGMIGNLIGAFIVILVGVSLIPVIAQQIDSAQNCPLYFYENITNMTGIPKGPTDSFGGGGSDYHFGGYDGQIVHKSFLSQYSIIQTNSSVFNPDCEPLSPTAKQALGFVPLFFALGIILMAIGVVYSSLRNVGCI